MYEKHNFNIGIVMGIFIVFVTQMYSRGVGQVYIFILF